VAQQPDGSIHSLFSAKEKVEKLPDSKRLEDQALCIRALLASAKRLELPLYRWSALDIYYAMNRSLFDQNRQFYYAELGADGKSNKAAGIRDVVLALLAGQELAEFMPNDTREQWERLSSRWIRSLQDL